MTRRQRRRSPHRPIDAVAERRRALGPLAALAVFIDAPRASIDRVLAKHAKVRDLVDNEWIDLFQLDAAERAVVARRNGAWR